MGQRLGDIVFGLAVDNRPFSAGVDRAAKDSKRATDTLKAELGSVSAHVNKLATEYVKGGSGVRGELDRWIAKEEELQNQIRERDQLVNSMRGGAAMAAPVAPPPPPATLSLQEEIERTAASYAERGRVGGKELDTLVSKELGLQTAVERTAVVMRLARANATGDMPAKLDLVQQKIAQVTVEYERQGRTGGKRLRDLLLLKQQLIATDSRRADMVRKQLADEAAAWGRVHASARGASTGVGAFAGGSRSATFALLELSRGVEDAAVVYGTTGLAGSIRASINNMSAFATLINPLAGVVVGFAGAIATLAIPALKSMGSEAETAAKKTEELAKRLKEVRDEAKKGQINIGAATGSADERIAVQQGLREGAKDRLDYAKRLTGTEDTRRGLVKELEQDVKKRRPGIDDLRATLGSIAFQSAGLAQAANAGEDVSEPRARLEAAREEVAARLRKEETALAEETNKLAEAQRALKKSIQERLAVEATQRGGPSIEEKKRAEEIAARRTEAERANTLIGVQNLDMVTRRRVGLEEQLEKLQERPKGRSDYRVEATDRRVAQDRIGDIEAGRREAFEQGWKEQQLKTLQEQLETAKRAEQAIRDLKRDKPTPVNIG